MVIQAFRELQCVIPEALLILAPRHPKRPGGPDSVLRSQGVRYVRRSELHAGTGQGDTPSIILLDTEGELADIYSIAEVAFIGGSLLPQYGGHSPVEALAWGVPITMGPYFGHQEALVARCRAERLLTICTHEKDLTAAWLKWAQDEEARRELRKRAVSLLANTHDIFLAWETLARNQASRIPRRVRASAVHDRGEYLL